jgi:integrin alpha FG-GAP repeat containing protein 1
LIQRDSSGGGISRSFTFVKNNYYHDAFFLKALVVNGACQGRCKDATTGESYDPYGVSYSGASYKFTVFDPTGTRRATQVGQLPQTSYLSLTTSYSYFGLGRTNNYVENLFVGSTRHQDRHYTNLEAVLPNSQLLVVPWQPAEATSPENWSKQLYLHPGDWIPGVTLSLLAAMVVLVITIGVLHSREIASGPCLMEFG